MIPALISEVFVAHFLVGETDTVGSFEQIVDISNVYVTLADLELSDLREIVFEILIRTSHDDTISVAGCVQRNRNSLQACKAESNAGRLCNHHI